MAADVQWLCVFGLNLEKWSKKQQSDKQKSQKTSFKNIWKYTMETVRYLKTELDCHYSECHWLSDGRTGFEFAQSHYWNYFKMGKWTFAEPVSTRTQLVNWCAYTFVGLWICECVLWADTGYESTLWLCSWHNAWASSFLLCLLSLSCPFSTLVYLPFSSAPLEDF